MGLKMRNRRQRGYPAALEAVVEPWRTWGDSGRQGERSEAAELPCLSGFAPSASPLEAARG